MDDSRQLFDRFDASSLAGRHLEEKIEQFIVHRAEAGRFAKYVLVVRVRDTPQSPIDAPAVSAGIREHFAHRAREEAAKLRALVSNGRRDLMVGFIFLFTCGALGVLAAKLLPATLGLLVQEGFVIIGWVALWRPVDLFLYELRPLRRQRNLLTALSKMEVRFKAS